MRSDNVIISLCFRRFTGGLIMLLFLFVLGGSQEG